MKLKAKRLRDGSWLNLAVERVLQVSGTQTLQNYLDKREATVVE